MAVPVANTAPPGLLLEPSKHKMRQRDKGTCRVILVRAQPSPACVYTAAIFPSSLESAELQPFDLEVHLPPLPNAVRHPVLCLPQTDPTMRGTPYPLDFMSPIWIILSSLVLLLPILASAPWARLLVTALLRPLSLSHSRDTAFPASILWAQVALADVSSCWPRW